MIGRHPLRGVYETRQFHFSKGIALRLFGVSLGLAQHNHQDVRNNKSAELLEGLGKQTHPIRTSSPEAQKFFDQSLALVFGFNHDEAARLFARAAELDPNSPMPHWGIALALGPNYNMPPIGAFVFRSFARQRDGLFNRFQACSSRSGMEPSG